MRVGTLKSPINFGRDGWRAGGNFLPALVGQVFEKGFGLRRFDVFKHPPGVLIAR